LSIRNCLLASIILLQIAPLIAEVRTDGSLNNGERTIVLKDETNTFVIDDEMGQASGDNLFHSFETFNLSSGENARFTTTAGENTASIAYNNVVARVTGNELSLINGRLSSDINGANLWFINPNGIVFGSGSSIQVQGSFFASTASRVLFADESLWSTQDVLDSDLPVVDPVGFKFSNSDTPKSIVFSGSELRSQSGNDLNFVGGDLFFKDAELSAIGGHVHIAALKGEGEIRFSDAGMSTSDSRYGLVSLDNSKITNFNSSLVTGNSANDDAQAIYIRAGRLLAVNESEISTHADAAGVANNIQIRADSIRLSDSIVSGFNAQGSTTNYGGDISLSGDAVEIVDGSEIRTRKQGNIIIESEGNIELSHSQIQTSAFASENEGKISITAEKAISRNSTVIQAGVDSSKVNIQEFEPVKLPAETPIDVNPGDTQFEAPIEFKNAELQIERIESEKVPLSESMAMKVGSRECDVANKGRESLYVTGGKPMVQNPNHYLGGDIDMFALLGAIENNQQQSLKLPKRQGMQYGDGCV